jgi:hypothetical protein
VALDHWICLPTDDKIRQVRPALFLSWGWCIGNSTGEFGATVAEVAAANPRGMQNKMSRMTFLLFLLFASAVAAQPQRWPEHQADSWHAEQPWLVGANYIPASAINQLEMWQADTFDPRRIDMEFGWAESIGMNTMRVFLHDLIWQQDAAGYRTRIDEFLRIAQKHKIRPIFVLFDSCWNPFPKPGKQPKPRPGIHNSGWVQGPGAEALQDPSQHARLEAYVKGVVGAFAKDKRVLAWDIWNEPDNRNETRFGTFEPARKVELVLALLPRVFAWTREAAPTQPLTAGVWTGDWSNPEKLRPVDNLLLEESDVISFHNYGGPDEFEQRVRWLRRYNRPILCTEYMARGNGSTFKGILPIARQYKVAAINWGLVAGKTQTNLPWDSWKRPYVNHQPAIWFSDVFRSDGKAYKVEEVKLIREMMGKK